jgi:hypothetical protein
VIKKQWTKKTGVFNASLGHSWIMSAFTIDALNKSKSRLKACQWMHGKGAIMSETNWTANWLRRTRITNDPAGYVIASMRRDPNVPPLFHHIGEMRGYLRRKCAPTEALAAVPTLWRRYADWLARHSAVQLRHPRGGRLRL